MWSGLVSYDPRTGGPVNAAAESVTSDDRKVWTVKLKPGGRFQDGSPVTSTSFTDAWKTVLREGWSGGHLFTEVAHIKGAKLKKPLYLRKLPNGNFTVTVSITLKKGKGLTERRRYTACK